MRILITGATGFIGSHITNTMHRVGHDLVICARNPNQAKRQFHYADCIKADFSNDMTVETWLPRLKNIDIVINAVGIIREHGNQTFASLHRDTPTALFQACEISGVKRVIQISALGADETAISQYHLTKRSADKVLENLSLEWAILRPSIVYGARAKSMALFKAIAGLPLIPLVDTGDQPVQPVHISDLLTAVEHCVEAKSPIHEKIELVGPEPISMKKLYCRLRNWLGYSTPRFISIPYPTALLFARWGGFLRKTPTDNKSIQMLRRGNTGDVNRFYGLYGYTPKSIDQCLADLPSQQADRWHADLYFLRPLLRWSIAFVWIFTGIVSAFVIPIDTSYAMLAKAGISGVFAPIMLYGASLTDILIGYAVLTRFQHTLVGWLQIALIVLYTTIITASQPEQWLHPFGPITKNAPMIMAILILMALEKNND